MLQPAMGVLLIHRGTRRAHVGGIQEWRHAPITRNTPSSIRQPRPTRRRFAPAIYSVYSHASARSHLRRACSVERGRRPAGAVCRATGSARIGHSGRADCSMRRSSVARPGTGSHAGRDHTAPGMPGTILTLWNVWAQCLNTWTKYQSVWWPCQHKASVRESLYLQQSAWEGLISNNH